MNRASRGRQAARALARIPRAAWAWLALAGLALGMEAVALYYQYRLDYYPCVLCIHVRVGVAGLALAALVGLAVRRARAARLVAQVMVVLLSAWMLERAWRLLGTERGFLEASCDFDAGLPAWLALDQWFPALFGVQEACGYTPPLPLGLTMAEALLGLFAALLACALACLIADALSRSGPD